MRKHYFGVYYSYKNGDLIRYAGAYCRELLLDYMRKVTDYGNVVLCAELEDPFYSHSVINKNFINLFDTLNVTFTTDPDDVEFCNPYRNSNRMFLKIEIKNQYYGETDNNKYYNAIPLLDATAFIYILRHLYSWVLAYDKPVSDLWTKIINKNELAYRELYRFYLWLRLNTEVLNDYPFSINKYLGFNGVFSFMQYQFASQKIPKEYIYAYIDVLKEAEEVRKAGYRRYWIYNLEYALERFYKKEV